MVLVGVERGVVVLCVSIDQDQLQLVRETYPEYELIEVEEGKNYEGYTYVNGVFLPPPEAAKQSGIRITRLAFLTRFTDEEAINIDLASIGATVEAAGIRRFLKKVDAASFIDLSDPDTISGVKLLEQIGFLLPGRADVILQAPVAPRELYTGNS